MNGQQLKKSILQLAIQGRLVPQNLKDEPASLLLARIREEKQRLVDEKIIKKEKALAPIMEEEKPFDIPESWEWVRLGEISLDSADGPFGSNLKAEHYTTKKQVRIVQLSNIGELGWKDNNIKYTTFTHLETIKRSEVFPGDIIIAKMMPAGRAIICPDEDIKYVLSSDAVRFDISAEIYKKYVYWAINSNVFLRQVYGNVQGITRVRTSLTKLREYIIPLPPLAEQHRIVAKIEELLPLVEEYDEAQKKLDKLNDELPEKLKKSVLQQAIMGRLGTQNDKDESASELLKRIKDEKAKLIKEKKIKKEKTLAPITDDEKSFDIPESWEWVRLGEVINLLSGRDLQPNNYSDKVDDGIPYMTGASNFDNDDLIVNRWTNNPITISHYGDLLFTCKGTIGTMCFNKIGDIHVARQIMAISSLWVDIRYIRYFLSISLDKLQKKAQSIIPGISRDNILLKCFPLPPLDEQHRIVEKLDKIFEKIESMKK